MGSLSRKNEEPKECIHICINIKRNGGVKQGILFRKLKSISLPIVLFISTYLLFEEIY